jgi:hypothetical protein
MPRVEKVAPVSSVIAPEFVDVAVPASSVKLVLAAMSSVVPALVPRLWMIVLLYESVTL